jgi:hypothetical protein
MVQAEVERINQSTRAPEMLAELKQALGYDPLRFARTVARPLVVERLLRERFDNDDALHAPQRREAERLREQLLQAKRDGASLERLVGLLAGSHVGRFSETTWQLAPRAGEKAPASSPFPVAASTSAPVKSTGGPFTLQASAQLAQGLPQPNTEELQPYFTDLPLELQQALCAQLRQPGDVSALIDMPSAFVVYVLKRRSGAEMTAAATSLAKRSFEDWVAAQPET